jgi:hypothetical protein
MRDGYRDFTAIHVAYAAADGAACMIFADRSDISGSPSGALLLCTMEPLLGHRRAHKIRVKILINFTSL